MPNSIFAHSPRKRFGQHFLTDSHILNRLIHALHIQPQQTVLEIGPGRGALTALLLQHPINVYGVELDRDLVALLRQQHPTLTVYSADALDFDYRHIYPQPYRVVGNLPYNIATPLIFCFTKTIDIFSDITIMVQKEVAERMTALPNSTSYGRLSVMCQYFFEMHKVMMVSPGAFHPPPKVMSMVLQLRPKRLADRTQCHPQQLEKVLKQAFTARRKKLSNTLVPLFSSEILRTSGVADRRAQTLSLNDYIRLTNLLSCSSKNSS